MVFVIKKDAYIHDAYFLWVPIISVLQDSIRLLRWLDSPVGVVYDHKNSRTDFIPAQQNLLNMKQGA